MKNKLPLQTLKEKYTNIFKAPIEPVSPWINNYFVDFYQVKFGLL